jgi:hypothetical protein
VPFCIVLVIFIRGPESSLWWRTSDNEYRVIYGDLRAETVSAEKLAELESKIPK